MYVSSSSESLQGALEELTRVSPRAPEEEAPPGDEALIKEVKSFQIDHGRPEYFEAAAASPARAPEPKQGDAALAGITLAEPSALQDVEECVETEPYEGDWVLPAGTEIVRVDLDETLRRYSNLDFVNESMSTLRGNSGWLPGAESVPWVEFCLQGVKPVAGIVTVANASCSDRPHCTFLVFYKQDLHSEQWRFLTRFTCEAASPTTRHTFERPIAARTVLLRIEHPVQGLSLRFALRVPQGPHDYVKDHCTPEENHPLEYCAWRIDLGWEPVQKQRWSDSSWSMLSWCRIGLCAFLAVLAFVLLMVFVPGSIRQLGQCRYGLVINSATNTMPLDQVYYPGRYWIGPGYNFVEFRSLLHTLDFSSSGRGDLVLRDSAGKQIRLTLTVQYQLIPEELIQLWHKRRTSYEPFLAAEMREKFIKVGNDIVFSDLWHRASWTRQLFLDACKAALVGTHARCWGVQIQSIALDSRLDAMITKTQVTKQAQKTEAARTRAKNIRMETQVMLAAYHRNLTIIDAAGKAEFFRITGEANASASRLLVETERANFDMIRDTLVVQRTGQNIGDDQFKTYQRLITFQDEQTTPWVYNYRSGGLQVRRQ